MRSRDNLGFALTFALNLGFCSVVLAVQWHKVRQGGVLQECSLPSRWSGREDLNLRPPQPHCGALPGCATPR